MLGPSPNVDGEALNLLVISPGLGPSRRGETRISGPGLAEIQPSQGRLPIKRRVPASRPAREAFRDPIEVGFVSAEACGGLVRLAIEPIAAMVRTAERGGNIKVTEFKRCRKQAAKQNLDQLHEAERGPAGTAPRARAQSEYSGTFPTRSGRR